MESRDSSSNSQGSTFPLKPDEIVHTKYCSFLFKVILIGVLVGGVILAVMLAMYITSIQSKDDLNHLNNIISIFSGQIKQQQRRRQRLRKQRVLQVRLHRRQVSVLIEKY